MTERLETSTSIELLKRLVKVRSLVALKLHFLFTFTDGFFTDGWRGTPSELLKWYQRETGSSSRKAKIEEALGVLESVDLVTIDRDGGTLFIRYTEQYSSITTSTENDIQPKEEQCSKGEPEQCSSEGVQSTPLPSPLSPQTPLSPYPSPRSNAQRRDERRNVSPYMSHSSEANWTNREYRERLIEETEQRRMKLEEVSKRKPPSFSPSAVIELMREDPSLSRMDAIKLMKERANEDTDEAP